MRKKYWNAGFKISYNWSNNYDTRLSHTHSNSIRFSMYLIAIANIKTLNE